MTDGWWKSWIGGGVLVAATLLLARHVSRTLDHTEAARDARVFRITLYADGGPVRRWRGDHFGGSSGGEFRFRDATSGRYIHVSGTITAEQE